MLPFIQESLAQTNVNAKAEAEDDSIIITYQPLIKRTGYVAPRIKIEFGARSTGEPTEPHKIVTDLAALLPEVSFPECTARVMRAERTFWEKATAIHVFRWQGALDGERFSRHGSDIVQLDDHGIVNRALNEPALAEKVAQHKSMFFRETDPGGQGDRLR